MEESQQGRPRVLEGNVLCEGDWENPYIRGYCANLEFFFLHLCLSRGPVPFPQSERKRGFIHTLIPTVFPHEQNKLVAE